MEVEDHEIDDEIEVLEAENVGEKEDAANLEQEDPD